MNVVFVTDFSNPAKRAAEVAAALAGRTGGRLLLTHVAPKPRIALSRGDVRDEVRAALEWRLRAEAARLAGKGAVVDSRALLAKPADAIFRAARGFAADVIVVATRRPRLFALWDLGFPRHLVRSTPVPVLALRDPDAFTPWTHGKRPLKVVVGYNFSRGAEAALEWVGRLSTAGGVDTTVAYITWPPDEAARYGIELSHAFENPPEVVRLLESDLREKCARHGIADARIRTSGTWGRKDLQLLAVALGENADVVVTGTGRRGVIGRIGTGSNCHAIIRESPLSVVCVPGSYRRRSASGQAYDIGFAQRVEDLPVLAESGPLRTYMKQNSRIIDESPVIAKRTDPASLN